MKRIVVCLLVLLFTLAAAGCGGKPDNGAAEAEKLVYVVDLCYIDSEYVATGNEELPALRYYKYQNMFAHEGKQYFVLLDEALRENPFGTDSIDTMITDKIQFRSVNVDNGTAFVDFAGETLNGGSFEEGLLISQIVYSLVGSFDEVDRVQFLIDGEITESLMGHYDATEPYEEGIYSIDK